VNVLIVFSGRDTVGNVSFDVKLERFLTNLTASGWKVNPSGGVGISVPYLENGAFFCKHSVKDGDGGNSSKETELHLIDHRIKRVSSN
jgi:hypothetical protein